MPRQVCDTPSEGASEEQLNAVMAASHGASQHQRLCFIVCVCAVFLLVLASREIPAPLIDPAAIDLTPLVNTLINTSQSGSRQLFSLLGVTSYSSPALHRLTLLLYNISSIRSPGGDRFGRRFCYCVTNDTNDLTGFTAVLLDVMGNSTSHLQELFKSASVLSVSQRDNSDCISICVMAGRTGGEVSELWEVDSITPLFNQTIMEGPNRANISSVRLPVEWQQPPTNLSHISPSGLSSMLTSRVHSTAHVSPTSLDETENFTAGQPPTAARQPATATPRIKVQTAAESPQTPTRSLQQSLMLAAASVTTAAARPTAAGPTTPSPVIGLSRLTTSPTSTVHPARPSAARRTTTPSRPVDKPGCPRRAAGWNGVSATVGSHKLQPCVLELCRFFSRCLCRTFSLKTRPKRYCDDSQVWYDKHTPEVCQRVRRVSLSRNLKQICLSKMCDQL